MASGRTMTEILREDIRVKDSHVTFRGFVVGEFINRDEAGIHAENLRRAVEELVNEVRTQ